MRVKENSSNLERKRDIRPWDTRRNFQAFEAYRKAPRYLPTTLIGTYHENADKRNLTRDQTSVITYEVLTLKRKTKPVKQSESVVRSILEPKVHQNTKISWKDTSAAVSAQSITSEGSSSMEKQEWKLPWLASSHGGNRKVLPSLKTPTHPWKLLKQYKSSCRQVREPYHETTNKVTRQTCHLNPMETYIWSIIKHPQAPDVMDVKPTFTYQIP